MTREILVDLILEEIRLTALFRSLRDLGVDADECMPDITQVVFKLAKIPITDITINHYFDTIELPQSNREESLKRANELVSFLLGE